MQILGKKGLGEYLKKILQICLVLGVIVSITLPFILKNYNFNLILSMIIIYPHSFLLALIANNFIKTFDSLEKSNPFCFENVSILKQTGYISLIQSFFWMLDFIVLLLWNKEMDIAKGLIIAFMFLLFIGVAIALFILSELFKKATEYKKENELTI